ncbi:Subtilisin-like protease SBT1.7 [Ananas comosus]|uniref:Subtilisin-like protease SBT1.7 n=1 Tax=Ananas comosus TaxID=4615 RepID=A0A199V3F8_ANACO|nr:Subtilisin-like protease SBT1.7 [Ananas comosus]
MQPPPPRWKGRCAFNASDCNNKLIGIRAFLHGLDNATMSPYDDGGHGTHVASTAAGMFVDKADVNGLANGTASGIAPYAHLAVYKVCHQNRCSLSDVLAGMDSAVHDGVDVLSLSLGGLSLPFYDDDLAIGALGAVEKGVFVSCATGNSGPSNGTTENEAPWILTVGASTMDRSVRATVELGNNISTFYGESLYQPDNFSAIPLPLIYPGLRGGLKTPYCVNGSLDGVDVPGKIIVCDAGAVTTVAKGRVVKAAGGLGMIVAYPQAVGFSTFENPHVLPASEVGYTDGLLIKAYAITASAPTASILFERTIVGTKPAPALVYFSSRGPNQADPNILKPDIIGPGVNVLAAWPFQVGSSDSGSYFNVISGTSMATPHLSGVAALLKSTHPDWSPAAIKSAIMTTATLIGNDNKPIVDETRALQISLGSAPAT